MLKGQHIKIGIGADHAGLSLKAAIMMQLHDQAINDFGTYTTDSVDYTDYAHVIAQAIEDKEIDYGILICGSGIGMSMAANRHKGVRAALCLTQEMARLARQHNDANVLVLGARLIDETTAHAIVQTFLTTDFERGRHERRVQKIEGK